MTAIRPLILFIVAALVQLGTLSPEFAAVIEANADAIVSGILALWALIAYRRNKKASLYAQEGSGALTSRRVP